MLASWGVASLRGSLFSMRMIFILTSKHSLVQVGNFLLLSSQQLGSTRLDSGGLNLTACWHRGKSGSAFILLKGFSTAEGHIKRQGPAEPRRPRIELEISLEWLAQKRYKQTLADTTRQEHQENVQWQTFWVGRDRDPARVCVCVIGVHALWFTETSVFGKCRHSAVMKA